MWSVFQWGRSALTGTNGSQKEQGLGYKAGGVKLLIHCFSNSFVLTEIATWGRALSWFLAAHNKAHPSDPTKYRALPSRHGYSTLPLIWLVGRVSHIIFCAWGCHNGSIFHHQQQSDAKMTSFCGVPAAFWTCITAFQRLLAWVHVEPNFLAFECIRLLLNFWNGCSSDSQKFCELFLCLGTIFIE